MSILLIRHGETASNAARIVQTPETPLSARGLAQAELLARRLEGSAIARILASDLSRATMTAQAVQGVTGAPLELDPLLQERNFGDHRGTPYAELEVDLFGPGYSPPGGESWELFHERVDQAWQRMARLAAEQDGDLAVVTHGLVCHSVVSRKVTLSDAVAAAADVGPTERPADGQVMPTPVLRFGNTALTIIEASQPFTVSRLACTAHLDDAHADDENAASGI
jgi:broad specificity phosphatase PhoE